MFFRFCVTTITAILMSACVSTAQHPKMPTQQLLDDSVFPAYPSFTIETEQQVFALNDAARAFVDKVIGEHKEQKAQIKALANSIFDRSDFNLLYRASANTVASETFDNRAANCLSMSIMTYSLAEYAGFRSRMQDIEIPEYWTRRDGFSLLNGHVNVLIEPVELSSNVIRFVTSETVVDFDPQESRRHFPVNVITRAKTLAMFYNNKGADALMDGSYSKAYAYFRAAAKTVPDFDSPWVNLGILYRRAGYSNLAEIAYERAIEVDSENLTAWENLAFLYAQEGQETLAQSIMRRVEKRRQDNPFYHFILGEQAFDAGKIDQALIYYRSAYRLDSSRHEVLFGLSKVYYEMGNVNRSVKFMQLAKKHSPNPQEENRYQGKLSKLQQAI